MSKSAALVWETTSDTASPYTLTNVARSFNDAFGTGGASVFYVYMINRQVPGEWMEALGHLSASDTLVIDAVLDGSNGTSEPTWSAGTKDVTSDLAVDDRIGKRWEGFRLDLPDVCLACDGLTIGSASSGATSRANADTWALFEKLWAVGNANGTLAIYTSAGAASTFGASAAADFAANKRLALPDVLTGNKHSRPADGTNLDVGEVQADGAPDIDATFTEVTAYGSGTATGAMSRTKDLENRPASGSADGRYSYTFAASADDPTYSDSVDEIRVNAIGVLVGIYYR
ncbi:hypothetical protein [Methyloceanibacter caenitepidi]|uniref:Uncharacterized protein n=1 Tax=Methyloceanibacter caenitepidi TaxID=1384459 RepID=A0A0A8K4K5_9HYPH|nr:hypothetical protein [Methyloceanibacter caenitepidi]BAQ16914.1 hypothetical protein GL4_1458 [Methyloceanibacter caenitepidi]